MAVHLSQKVDVDILTPQRRFFANTMPSIHRTQISLYRLMLIMKQVSAPISSQFVDSILTFFVFYKQGNADNHYARVFDEFCKRKGVRPYRLTLLNLTSA